MNASKLIALLVAVSVMAPSFGQAGQAIGTAKAQGNFRSFGQAQRSVARSVTRSRPVYRYSAPMSAPVIVQSPMTREAPAPVVAQAPDEARRFSEAPATENQAAESPAPTTSSGDRRYSSAPAAEFSSGTIRCYPGNAGQPGQPLWSLPKTDPRKFNSQ